MANVKISALPAATAAGTTDLLPLVQGGVTKQLPLDLLPIPAAVTAALAAKAGLVSPAFTGSPTIGGTAVAKISDIAAAVSQLLGGVSTAYDTLGELAAQLATDENAAAALTALVGQKSLFLPVNVITPAGNSVRNAVIGARNSVDASSGPVTVALPTPTSVGQHLILERADASAVTANAITVTGTIRNAPSTVVLNAVGAAFEGALYIAESLTSWAIAGSIKPRAVLDAAYEAKGAVAAYAVPKAKAATGRAVSYFTGGYTPFPRRASAVPMITTSNSDPSISPASNAKFFSHGIAAGTSGLVGPVVTPIATVHGSATFATNASAQLASVAPHGVTGTMPVWEWETDSPYFSLKGSVGAAGWYLYVNDELAYGSDVLPNFQGNSQVYVQWGDGSNAFRQWRKYRIEAGNAFGLTGFAGSILDTFAPVDITQRVRLGLLGDSYSGGFHGWGWQFARLMGWDVYLPSTDGGTGYQNVNGAASNYQTRVPDVIAANPDVIVIQGGLNDQLTGLQAAVTAVLQAIRTALPKVPVYVMLPNTPTGSTYAEQSAKYTAITTAAAGFTGVTLIDPHLWFTGTGSTASRTITDGVLNSTTTITSATANFTSRYDVGDLVTGTGIPAGTRIASVTNATTAVLTAAATATAVGVSLTLAEQHGDGNNDVYLNSDHTHPNSGGHALLAARMASAVRATLTY